MREIPSYLQGHENVVSAYGRWPSFHDAPVIRWANHADVIELEVEAGEMTSEVDAQGYYVIAKRCLVAFRFTAIIATELDVFLPENILFELGFSSVADLAMNGSFEVVLDSAMGSDLGGRFTATSGEIVQVKLMN